MIGNPLDSELAFPVLECFHIVGFAVAIGSVALIDFRLLGLGLRRQKASDLIQETDLWVLISLMTAIFSGLVLYSTDPDKYYLNAPFVIKVVCLVLVILFNYTIHRKIVLSGEIGGKARVVACISLVLWISVVAGGMVVSFTAV